MRQYPTSLMKFTERKNYQRYSKDYQQQKSRFNLITYSQLKQTNACRMGGPLSVTLVHIHKIEIATDVVVPTRSIIYKRYVDDIYNRHRKNIVDIYMMG